MSTLRYIFYLPILLILGRQVILYLQDPSDAVNRVQSRLASLKVNNEFEVVKVPEEVVIAAVACGNIERLGELSVMIKSAVIFSTKKPVKFIIFTDHLARDIEKILTYWKQFKEYSISWDIRPALYPPLTQTQESIKTEFAPCATQRLFFPQILPEYKYVLYVDTDIIFLQDPDITWQKLQRMSDKSFGLVTENDDDFYSAYTYSPIPHPSNGLNSGVMLMNLHNLRQNQWHEKMLTIFEELQSHMAFVDQDMLNIYSYLYPNELEFLPCSANFRADFCLNSTCLNDDLGLIMHGSRAAFHDKWQFGGSFFTSYLPKMMHWFLFKNLRLVEYAFAIQPVMDKQQLFQAVYKAFGNHELGIQTMDDLRNDLKSRLEQVPETDLCYYLKDLILKCIQ